MPRLFVDISAHGLGHLAQVAPVLGALAALCPALELTVRSALPAGRLQRRLRLPFRHIAAASDVGFAMVDAMRIDAAATARAYRAAHADWPARVAADATLLGELRPDFVFSDVSYLPLAAAARLCVPAAAMSSLNWADLVAHYFAGEGWAPKLLDEMRAAYAGAYFLAPRPAMAMPWLPRLLPFGPVAALGAERREELRRRLAIPARSRLVVIALGGLPGRLPVERWLARDDIVWLAPAAWGATGACSRALEAIDWDFPDLLASVDAVVTKPGYGSFVEAACNGTPTAFVRRDDWPEQEPLIDWLTTVARAVELSPPALAGAGVGEQLDRLWALPAMAPVPASGTAEIAAWLAQQLRA